MIGNGLHLRQMIGASVVGVVCNVGLDGGSNVDPEIRKAEPPTDKELLEEALTWGYASWDDFMKAYEEALKEAGPEAQYAK